MNITTWILRIWNKFSNGLPYLSWSRLMAWRARRAVQIASQKKKKREDAQWGSGPCGLLASAAKTGLYNASSSASISNTKEWIGEKTHLQFDIYWVNGYRCLASRTKSRMLFAPNSGWGRECSTCDHDQWTPVSSTYQKKKRRSNTSV